MPWIRPNYGRKIQLAKQLSSSTNLNTENTNSVQYINGSFIYYDRAIAPTMLLDLNETATFQSTLTQDIFTKCNQVLDYSATHPHKKIRYHVSDIILLMTYNDAAYFILNSDRSFIAGHYYLTNHMLDYYKGTPTSNSPILTELKTLKTVVSSSYESETQGIFKNSQKCIPSDIFSNFLLNIQPKEGSQIITKNLHHLLF